MKIIVKVAGILVLVGALAVLAIWLKYRGPDIPYETLEKKYATEGSHFVDLPNGALTHATWPDRAAALFPPCDTPAQQATVPDPVVPT